MPRERQNRLLSFRVPDMISGSIESQSTYGVPRCMNWRLVANHSFSLLLAVAMIWPSWLWGNCCCSRRNVAPKSCCQSKPVVETKKACCARAALAKSNRVLASEIRSTATCRCHSQIQSTQVVTSVRSSDLITPPADAVPSDRVFAISLTDQQDPAISRGRHWRVPISSSDRCAQLCRWHA